MKDPISNSAELMDLATFTQLIGSLESHHHKVHEAYKLGIDILDFVDNYYGKVINPLMTAVFGTEGVAWIEWYLYERDSKTGERLKAWDARGNEICQDIPSLYQTISEEVKATQKQKQA